MENNAMKNFFKVTALTCLMAAASNAMAGPSANVQIKGTVIQGACTPSLNNNGVFPIANLTLDQLPATGFQNLNVIVGDLTVTCSSPTKLQVNFTDNRYDSTDQQASVGTDKSRMGLGFSSQNVKIGAWALGFSSEGTIDGAAALTLNGSSSDGPYHLSGGVFYWSTNTGTPDFISLTTGDGTEPAAGKIFTFPLFAEVSISSSLRSSTEEVNVDGNATLNIEYL
jgi:type 1 fimbria pilin